MNENSLLYGNYYIANGHDNCMYCSFHKVKVVFKEDRPFCEECNEFVQCLPEKEFEEKRKRVLGL